MLSTKTILLKLSGEALKNSSSDCWDYKVLNKLVDVIKTLLEKNYKIGIEVGGGNIFRGRIAEENNLDRINADFIGMLATNLNALMLENVFKQNNIDCELYSEIECKNVILKYKKNEALKDLKKNKVLIFGGGTGRPFVSTDTGCMLKAKDIKAELVLVGKNGVEGIYSDDPISNKDAKLYKNISYDTLISTNNKAMDIESIKLAKEFNLKIRVFNMNKIENILKVLEDEKMGTTIGKE